MADYLTDDIVVQRCREIRGLSIKRGVIGRKDTKYGVKYERLGMPGHEDRQRMAENSLARS